MLSKKERAPARKKRRGFDKTARPVWFYSQILGQSLHGTCAIPARLSCIQFVSTDVLQVLFRFFSPFRLMKDVSRGSFEERMAAYRHNRRMRGHLPVCMLRWAASCSIAVLLTAYFDALGGGAATAGTPSIFVLLAAACATFIACGVCVLFVTAYVYFYLAHHDY